MNDLINFFDDLNDEITTEADDSSYAAWIAEMDEKLKAAMEEDELDMEDDFYDCYKGVVKPDVYFNGIAVDTENMPTYDEIIDNYQPIYPDFE